MVRDHQKCHHVVAAWTVSHNTAVLICLAVCWLIVSKTGAGEMGIYPRFFLWSWRFRDSGI